MDAAAAAIGSMEVHVNNAGVDEMVTLTQIQTFLSVDYSLTEQVWPNAKWIGGVNIKWRTFQLGVESSSAELVGLSTTRILMITCSANRQPDNAPVYLPVSATYLIAPTNKWFVSGLGTIVSGYVTVWYL